MIKKFCFALIILGFSTGHAISQSFVKTSDLFQRQKENPRAGRLNLIQDPSIDTLISRYILVNTNLYENSGYYGMKGYRIQIYSSSNRNAREESGKVRAEFMSKFPDITSYQLFADPGYFKIRVGDFRTKTEATKLFLLISKYFPDAYLVPDFIDFPDANTK
ncbi:MAG: SPOR domain-containing protein [Bacteroidota bacterium]